MSTEFKNKVVMVTGAGGNLGRAVTAHFATHGAKLILIDAKMEFLESAVQALGLAKSRTLLATGDLGKPKDVESIVGKAERKFKTIDVLVHTVGGFAMGDPVHAGNLEVYNKMMYMNAQTVYITLGRIAQHMLSHQIKGSMVAILARSGLKGGKNMAAYTASKAAAERIIQSMAEELKESGIRVNGVMPSTIDTPANRRDMPNADFSKWVTPQQLADTIGFLCSDAASAINGDSIAVYHNA
jgi:NAD(P)-dependent dehydrogenase (short-subunit alcohol dehydrogenase family)